MLMRTMSGADGSYPSLGVTPGIEQSALLAMDKDILCPQRFLVSP
jgi:hypothetical protein